MAFPTDISTQRTEAQMKTDLDAFLAGVKALPGGAAATTLTIAAGVVTPTGAFHKIDTEGAAASDDLTNANTTNLPAGSILILQAINAGRKPTVKNSSGGSGQFVTVDGADFVLSSVDHTIGFVRYGSDWKEIFRAGGSVGFTSFAEHQTSGTDAGGFTANAWTKRTLNTTVSNLGSYVSISASVMTPAAGTYIVRWSAPGFDVQRHQSRLRNTTTSATAGVGQVADTVSGVLTHSTGVVLVTTSGGENFELQHQCTSTKATDGLGKAAGLSSTPEVEVYSICEWTKVG